jgi:hypothetical protein
VAAFGGEKKLPVRCAVWSCGAVSRLKVDPAMEGHVPAGGVAGSTRRLERPRDFVLPWCSINNDDNPTKRKEILDVTLKSQKQLISNLIFLSLGLRTNTNTLLSNPRRASDKGASQTSRNQQTRLPVYGRTPSAGFCRAYKKEQYATTTKAFDGQITFSCASLITNRSIRRSITSRIYGLGSHHTRRNEAERARL